ncbi:MAG TPA: SCO family protein [Acidimicrobiales bacterium]|nr:SCO family protein [Acidimicrobiales bacterium]
MPGMGRALQSNNPTIVSAFHSAVLHQMLVVLAVLAVVALAWNGLRTVQYRRVTAAGAGPADGTPPARPASWLPEPDARRFLRISFGVLWILDGLLQLQQAMPLGLPGNVLQPAASTSPGWVQHLVNVGVTIWSNHPVQAAASAVWIQIGLGVLLLVAPRGRWSRFAGLATVGWGLVVWVFGEAFGGIFAPGLTWLFGAPGAVLFYVVAGALIALPDRAWVGPRLGRAVLGGLGIFFIGMAVLQAWPGRGFWQGSGRGSSGTLAGMVDQMSHTTQPHLFSSAVSSFASFDAAHGWGVNLFVVVALAGTGAALLSRRRAVVSGGVVASLVLCLGAWVLVEDLGFFGGTGTDPNSMIPMALVIVSGYLAEVRAPAVAEAPAPSPTSAAAAPWWQRLTPGYLTRALAALAAVAVIAVGAAPMAAAAVNPNADPIVAEASDGTPNLVTTPAPPFRLVDQHGAPVSLADLHGRVVALTFLDPVCTTDCPVIAQEFREADATLGASAGKVEFVAVVANPLYRSVAVVDAFDRQEGLGNVPNWLFLTGTVPQLERVWSSYAIQAVVSPAGAMVAHSEVAYLIDARGDTRVVLDTAPAPGSAARSSFTVLLSNQLEHLLHP